MPKIIPKAIINKGSYEQSLHIILPSTKLIGLNNIIANNILKNKNLSNIYFLFNLSLNK